MANPTYDPTPFPSNSDHASGLVPPRLGAMDRQIIGSGWQPSEGDVLPPRPSQNQDLILHLQLYQFGVLQSMLDRGESVRRIGVSDLMRGSRIEVTEDSGVIEFRVNEGMGS